MNNLTLVYLIPQAFKNKLCKSQRAAFTAEAQSATAVGNSHFSRADQGNSITSRTAHGVPALAGLCAGYRNSVLLWAAQSQTCTLASLQAGALDGLARGFSQQSSRGMLSPQEHSWGIFKGIFSVLHCNSPQRS